MAVRIRASFRDHKGQTGTVELSVPHLDYAAETIYDWAFDYEMKQGLSVDDAMISASDAAERFLDALPLADLYSAAYQMSTTLAYLEADGPPQDVLHNLCNIADDMMRRKIRELVPAPAPTARVAPLPTVANHDTHRHFKQPLRKFGT